MKFRAINGAGYDSSANQNRLAKFTRFALSCFPTQSHFREIIGTAHAAAEKERSGGFRVVRYQSSKKLEQTDDFQ